jgi:hypothetical protein
MPKFIAAVTRVTALVLLATTMVSCGSSSSTQQNGSNNGPYNVIGDWMLTITSGGSSASGPGVITTSGQAVFFQTNPSIAGGSQAVAVLPTITGASSFSGTATVYGFANGTGWQVQSQSVQGKVNSSTSISGTAANGGTFSLAPNAALSGSVKALSTTMWAQGVGFFGNVALQPTGQNQSMTISSTVNPANVCVANGTLNQEANLNVFDVSITFGGGGCPHDIHGIGFESNTDYFQVSGGAQGTFLYVVDSSSTTVVEIFP